jgi:hypothetical protein
MLEGKTVDGAIEVRERLWASARASLYEAYDHELGRLVAIKTGDDVVNEGKRLASVGHPCAATVHRSTRDGKMLVLERVTGVTLLTRLQGGVKPTVAAAVDLLYGLADGLCALHRVGLRLGRLRPEWIYLSGSRVVLLPFGLDETPSSPVEVDARALAALAFELLGHDAAERLDLPDGLGELLLALDHTASLAGVPERLRALAG